MMGLSKCATYSIIIVHPAVSREFRSIWQGLHSVIVKKCNYRTSYDSIPDDKENILKRDFDAETIDKMVYAQLPTSIY